MSEIFEITGPDGKRYRIEANDGVSQEQALQEFQNLGDEDRMAFEYNDAPAPQTRAPAPRAPAQAAAPVAVPEQAPVARPEDIGAIKANTSTGVQTRNTNAKANAPEVNEILAAEWQKGVRDPDALWAAIAPVVAKYPELAGYENNINAKTVAEAQQYEAAMRASGREMEGNVFAPVTYDTGQPEYEKPTTLGGQFTEASQRSLANMGNTAVGLGALGADLVGADETSDALLEEFINNQAAIAYEYGTPMRTEEVEDLGSFSMFFADTLGELAPQLVGSMGLGYLGKQAATAAIRKGAAEMVETQVQNGVAREAAEKAVAASLRKRATLGAAAGSGASTVAQETGGTFGQTYMKTGEKAPLSSIMAGVASGSLDAILPVATLNRLGGQNLVNAFKKNFLQRAAKDATKGFALEGATEALQTFITNLPANVINGESPLSAETLDEMNEAFWRGGLGGATVNTATSTVEQMRAPAYDPVAEQFPKTNNIAEPTATVRNSKEFRTQLAATTAQVQDLATQLTSTWTNAPSEVKALPTFNAKEMRANNAVGVDRNAIGVYTEDGRVLINTEALLKQAKRRNVSPDAMVASVTFHEGLGHHGLTQTFGAQLDEALDTLYTRGKPEFQDQVDRWIAKNPNAYTGGDPNGAYSVEAYQQIRATEEVMAEIAENEGVVQRDFYDRVADLVKNTARRMGMSWQYSSREVRSILAVAQRNVLKGDPTGQTPGTVKNKIVYHGSGANFDKFDHSKMGTGEGQQIFGWGTYLSDVKGIAQSYKERFSKQEASFGGRRGPIWQLRDIAEQRAIDEGMSQEAFEALASAFTVKSQFYPNREITGNTVYNDFLATVEDPNWSQLPQETRDALDEAAKFVNDNYKVEYSGKLYEVDIPDNAKWVEWEQPLSEQPELNEALKKIGLDFDGEYNPTGEEVYSSLVNEFGDASEASDWLAANGFTGNRYLASNISRRKSRQGEGKDKFNYVVFDDNTPKIVNKYMKPTDTTSAGFQRQGTDSRSQTEARKQLWRNKTNPEWDNRYPNGVPPRSAKFMRADTPIDPDDLTADDLVNSENALNLLERASELYQPSTVDIDALQQDVVDRGVKPSDVTRLARMNPAKLAQRVFMYDVAAEKLQTRLLNLEEDISTNGLTAEKQAAYLSTQATLDELFGDIFDFQAEIGRTLSTIRKANFTRRRMAMTAEGLRDMLNKDNLGALADPETFLRFMRQNSEARKTAADEQNARTNTRGQKILQYAGIPRALMSSFDLSAPMRQGITLIGTTQYWSSFFKMFSMMGKSGRANYDFLMRNIGRDENYNLMLKARLSFSQLDGSLSSREEDFQTDLARKIPILGIGVAQSEQAYAGFLNKLRADTFNKIVNQYKDADGDVDDKLLIDIGKFVNSATGRADLPGGLKSMGPQLNTAFFSARLIQSRFNMLNPVFYARLDPRVRYKAMAEMGKMGAILLAVGWALSLIPGAMGEEEAEVELDPRSADFLKIKVGDTRFDIGGGYNQYLTLGARSYLWVQNQVTGWDIPEEKSTSGKLKLYGEKTMYGKTYVEELLRFGRNKLSPNTSYFVDALAGENVIGVEFNVLGSAASRMVPMYLSSTVEITKQEGLDKGIRYSVPAIFGVGVNSYAPKTRDPDQTLDAPAEYKEVPLRGEAKDWYEATLNNYFKASVFAMTVSTGFKEWGDLPKNVQEQIIADAIAEAKKNTKEDAEATLVYEE